ncbi:MAG: SDR family oxidoreductase [Anaerolineae bacterium]|nr:SDR family oxidoreductase [Anaerolineae bacterium]
MSILDRFSLQGKVALVTGGAGKYGRQIVAALTEAGARTYIAARRLDKLEALAAEHRAAGHDVRALRFDQGDESSILALRDTILRESSRFDILVNNAVLDTVMKGYQDSAANFAESMRVNATGLFIITRAFGDAMAAQGSGSIINIGSIYGMVALDPTIYRGTNMSGWNPDYFFHKGGMVNCTRFVASYYGAQGVRCNCVIAGGFQTVSHPEVFVRQFSERTLLGRMANSTDLMGIIVFLASEASAYVTGANIPVDGGFTAK